MSQVLDTKALREKNKDLIRASLKDVEFATKQSLSVLTGLSVASCGNLLKELIATSEVIELELAASSGGRPARRFRYNESFKLLLVIYLRKEQNNEIMHISVSDLKGNTLYDETKTIMIDLNSIECVISSYIEQFNTISYISIGIPGIVRDKSYIKTCDIQSLNKCHLKTHLINRFNLDVILENDVNAIALGYYSIVEEEDPESLVYIYYPEDGYPGAGIVIHGKTLYGVKHIAGEVKYLEHSTHNSFVASVWETINAVNSIINPNYIVLSGNKFRESTIHQIQERIKRTPFSPYVLFENDIHDHYILGLKFNAFTLLH